VHIEDILYGNWEARDPETQVAPVVHLQSYLDMHQWIRAAKVLSQLNKPTKKQLLSIAPFALIYPQVMQRLKMVEEDETEWERQWRLAKLFAQNRQYTQAIIVLREMLITFTAELMGFSITNSHIR